MPNEAHVRIDKGVTRGPRQRTSPQVALNAPQRPLSVALKPLHQFSPEARQNIANAVLERYTNGEQVAAIAPEFGVSDVTIYALLLREHEAAWKDIQTARALARLENSQEGLRVARDARSLARARELVRSAQWELERILNRLYGPKQELTITDNTDLGERLRRSRERTIEGESSVVVADTPNGAVLPVITVSDKQE